MSIILKNLTLITGGARSGKSELAETLASESKLPVYYIATMQPIKDDKEAITKIETHKKRRPKDWITIESWSDLDQTISKLKDSPACILIDCLTVYVSNLLLNDFQESAAYDKQETILQSMQLLLDIVSQKRELYFIAVTSEVGWSIVPESPLSRAYRDILGLTNQIFAKHANRVWLTCSGLKIQLK